MGWLSNLFGGDDAPEPEREDAPEGNAGGDDRREPLPTPDRDPATYTAAVLFRDEPRIEAGDLREIVDDAGMEIESIDSPSEGTYRLSRPEASLTIDLHPEPIPEDRTNRELLPAEFPRDRGYVGVFGGRSDPLERRDQQRNPAEFADPWGPWGVARQTTRLVRQLLEEGGLAVALNRAGGLVVPAQQFLSISEDLDDPDIRPWEAWLQISRDGSEGPLETSGLVLFGLPDVSVRFDHESDYWRARRELEALKYAAGTMIHENRVLGADPDVEGRFGFEPLDDFEVPLGVEAGAEMPDVDEAADTLSYEVRLEDDRLEFTAEGDATVWKTWSEIENSDEDATIALASYQALFRKVLSEALDRAPDISLRVDEFPELEPFDCEIFRGESSATTLMVTNGMGRRPFAETASGTPDTDDSPIELAIRTVRDGGRVLDVVANVAAGIALDEDRYGPGDTLHFEEPLYGMQYFLLANFTEVRPSSGGPSIAILLLVPLSDDEFETIEREGAEEWLQEHDAAGSREIAERWARVVQ